MTQIAAYAEWKAMVASQLGGDETRATVSVGFSDATDATDATSATEATGTAGARAGLGPAPGPPALAGRSAREDERGLLRLSASRPRRAAHHVRYAPLLVTRWMNSTGPPPDAEGHE